MPNPNLIERMENLILCIEEAQTGIVEPAATVFTPTQALDNAYGIAGEILTMIDGR